MTVSHRFNAEPPAFGDAVEIRPGILWIRLPLPYRLNHVNIYVLDDGAGWTVIDTGIGTDQSIQAWRTLMAGVLTGRPVNRIICTHHHPDHVGMVGWLCRETGAELLMGEVEFLLAQYYANAPHAIDGRAFRQLYLLHGLSEDFVAHMMSEGHDYQRRTTGLPLSFTRLVAGQTVMIGERAFEIVTGGGHSSLQVMLYCREDGLFVAADQVLPRITPNIGVAGIEPSSDPLQHFFTSLASIREAIPDGALTLPGHDWPFTGLHQRIDTLVEHHHARCDIVAEACRDGARTVADLVPVLFDQHLSHHQMSFAFAETLSHVNYMIGQGRLGLDTSGPVWSVGLTDRGPL